MASAYGSSQGSFLIIFNTSSIVSVNFRECTQTYKINRINWYKNVKFLLPFNNI